MMKRMRRKIARREKKREEDGCGSNYLF